jgi:hypothetical protein
MCGITGVLRFGKPTTPAFNMSALYLATHLLESAEIRGKDATGVSALFDDGNFFVQKMAIAAKEFTARAGGKPDDYEGLLAVLRDYSKAPLRCFIGHCRKKSAGALNNVDNHPIKAGNILGVHNGTLKNDKEIFEKLGCERDGKVDSEAIFRLLQFFTNDCADPFTLDSIEESCKRLEGTFSILAFNANNPYQVVSARDGRPAEYCLIRPLGLVLVASEKKFIDTALYNYNKLARLFPTGNDTTAFVSLTQEDIEYVMLPDDTVALFDLTIDITADTKLKDLYTSRKLPLAAQRLWKSAVTTTYGGNTYAGNRNTNVGDKKTTTTNNTTATTQATQQGGATTQTSKTSTGASTEPKTSSGRFWSTNLDRFVINFGKKQLVAAGAIVNTEKKTVKDIADGYLEIAKDAEELAKRRADENSEVKKTETARGVAEGNLNLVSVRTDTETFGSGEAVNFTDLSPKAGSASTGKAGSEEAITEMKDGIEKGKQAVAGELKAQEAAIAAAKLLDKFKTDFDVAEFLQVELSVLEELPPAPLVNRLIRKLFAKFFTEGWLACYNSDVIKDTDTAVVDKLAKAEKYVRVLKTLQSGLLNELVCADDENLRIVSEIVKTLRETGELTKDVAQTLFTAGDMRESAIIKKVVDTL